MGDVKITSENQSGGITAQNVNAANDAMQINQEMIQNDKQRTSFWKIFLGILAALSAIAGIVTFILKFGVKP